MLISNFDFHYHKTFRNKEQNIDTKIQYKFINLFSINRTFFVFCHTQLTSNCNSFFFFGLHFYKKINNYCHKVSENKVIPTKHFHNK